VAKEHDVGIIWVKPFGMGLFGEVKTSLRYILSQEMGAVIPGMRSPAQVDENLSVLDELSPVSEEEREAVIRRAEGQRGRSFCRGCELCKPCPQGVDVRAVLRLENYFSRYYMMDSARHMYRTLPVKASLCAKCARCEVDCQYIPELRRMLIGAHQQLAPSFAFIRGWRRRLKQRITGLEH